MTATGPLPNSTERDESSHDRLPPSQPLHAQGECCDERTRTVDPNPRGPFSETGPFCALAVSEPSAHLSPTNLIDTGPFSAVSSMVPLPPSKAIGPFCVWAVTRPLTSLSAIGPFWAFALVVPASCDSWIGPLVASRS